MPHWETPVGLCSAFIEGGELFLPRQAYALEPSRLGVEEDVSILQQKSDKPKVVGMSTNERKPDDDDIECCQGPYQSD